MGLGVGIEASLNILEPARHLSTKVGDDAIHLRVLDFLAFTYCTLLEHQKEARTTITEVRQIGDRLHEAHVIGRARFWKGYTSTYEGDLSAANEDFDHALMLSADTSSTRITPMNWYIQTRSLSSLVLWLLGYPEHAKTRSNQALALAHDPGSHLLVDNNHCNVLLRNAAALVGQFERSLLAHGGNCPAGYRR